VRYVYFEGRLIEWRKLLEARREQRKQNEKK